MTGLVIAFWYVVRSGKLLKGLFIGWGLSIICFFLISTVVPALVGTLDSEYRLYFPEEIGLPIVIALGWIPALIVSTVAALIRHLMRSWKKSDGEPKRGY